MIQAEINELNNTILIAQRCLDTDRPDMKYVTDGARYITVGFLDFSIFIAFDRCRDRRFCHCKRISAGNDTPADDTPQDTHKDTDVQVYRRAFDLLCHLYGGLYHQPADERCAFRVC